MFFSYLVIFILNFKFIDDTNPGTIKIALKYHPVTKQSAINQLKRISKPGLRIYANQKELPRVLGGLGIAVISTSKGIMTDNNARNQNLGGEVLCYIW